MRGRHGVTCRVGKDSSLQTSDWKVGHGRGVQSLQPGKADRQPPHHPPAGLRAQERAPVLTLPSSSCRPLFVVLFETLVKGPQSPTTGALKDSNPSWLFLSPRLAEATVVVPRFSGHEAPIPTASLGAELGYQPRSLTHHPTPGCIPPRVGP